MPKRGSPNSGLAKRQKPQPRQSAVAWKLARIESALRGVPSRSVGACHGPPKQEAQQRKRAHLRPTDDVVRLRFSLPTLFVWGRNTPPVLLDYDRTRPSLSERRQAAPGAVAGTGGARLAGHVAGSLRRCALWLSRTSSDLAQRHEWCGHRSCHPSVLMMEASEPRD